MSRDKEVYSQFGSHLKQFLLNEWDSISVAADKLHENKSYISQVIHGHRPPSQKLKEKLIYRGFDEKHFAVLEGIAEVNPDLLDYEEMKFIYVELKKLLQEKNDIIKWQEKRIDELRVGLLRK